MARNRDIDPRRRAAYRRGLLGERLAALLLRAKFHRILARRYRTPAGEIDLIARRGRTIVFVEVKHRPSEAAGLYAVPLAARRRIIRAADLWMAAHPAAAGFDRRFDLVVVVPRRLPRHVANIFDAMGQS